MAVGDSYHSGPDISLPGLIRNSAFSGYVKSMISSPNFLSVVTSITGRGWLCIMMPGASGQSDSDGGGHCRRCHAAANR